MSEFLMLIAFILALFVGLSAGWYFLSRAGQQGNTISDGSEYESGDSRYEVFQSFIQK